MALTSVQLLRKQTEAWGCSLDDSAVESLVSYARFLEDYRVANIIGVRDISLVLRDHILDSLSCVLAKPIYDARSLVDVGSGGGLPGVPLKIVRPDLRVGLVEATSKKAEFLRRAVDHLSLGDTEIINARVEKLGHEADHRGFYDVSTARAVASLSVLVEYCLPLVRQGGYFIAMKADLSREEAEAGRRAARIVGAELSDEIPVSFLPEIPAKRRQLLIFTKTSATPLEYPRRVGLPKKRPLGLG